MRMMQGKLRGIVDPAEASSIDDRAFLSYMYGERAAVDTTEGRNGKQSVSFHAESLMDETSLDALAPSKDQGGKKEKSEYANVPNDSIKEVDNDNDDDMARLGKLSLINMGARYELLNANKMLLDFDISLRVRTRVRRGRSRRCRIETRTSQRCSWMSVCWIRRLCSARTANT